MSVFQFDATAGAVEINKAITANTVTTIVDATDKTIFVAWFQVNETAAGTTPNLTVDIYDGTNTRYLGGTDGSTWNALAVAAKQSVRFTDGYVIPKGSLLRVTSSNASGLFHVHGVAIRSY